MAKKRGTLTASDRIIDEVITKLRLLGAIPLRAPKALDPGRIAYENRWVTMEWEDVPESTCFELHLCLRRRPKPFGWQVSTIRLFRVEAPTVKFPHRQSTPLFDLRDEQSCEYFLSLANKFFGKAGPADHFQMTQTRLLWAQTVFSMTAREGSERPPEFPPEADPPYNTFSKRWRRTSPKPRTMRGGGGLLFMLR